MPSNPSVLAPPAAPAAPRVGRPRRVDAQAIIKAALEIGLDRVTLKQVADHLGVAISTLYRHVRNRDELVRLAAFRRAIMRRPPHACDSHWSEVAFQHAESLFEALIDEPRLITELMRGRLGPAVEVDYVESFLALICPHGFSAAEGLYLYRAIAMLTLGGAIGAIAVEASQLADVPQAEAVRHILAGRPPGELPLLRGAEREYGQLEPKTWLGAIRDLLAGVAQSRGEVLPPAVSALGRGAA